MRIAFIGTSGIPNRYGGFESFLEQCAPVISHMGHRVTVTCDARLYEDRSPLFNGVRRLFLRTPANGPWSILHDLIAFFKVYGDNTHIVVLGVSGGIWFLLFRILTEIGRKKLIVNIDGLEWRRARYSLPTRWLLLLSDALAQLLAHCVIYDNEGLREHLFKFSVEKAACVVYPGDYIIRTSGLCMKPGNALTIARIEPENNIDMLIEGFLGSNLLLYTIVGNWFYTEYGRRLYQRYSSNSRLNFLHPVYEFSTLDALRETCGVYIHGHSVGGTNPSLVEILFYDCEILCFDNIFNRFTAGGCARYFDSSGSLAHLLDSERQLGGVARFIVRKRYNRSLIAAKYIELMQGSRVECGHTGYS